MSSFRYLAIIYVLFALGACNFTAASKPRCIDGAAKKGIGIANPAAVYCKGLGYDLEIRTGEGGGQSGYCIFPDKSACEEWKFFRGQCGQKFTFCERSGGRIETRTEDRDGMNATYAVCILKDGTKCPESDFAQCRCP